MDRAKSVETAVQIRMNAMASVVYSSWDLRMRYVAVRVRADRAPQRKDAEMAQQKSEKFIRSASQAARSHAHAHGL